MRRRSIAWCRASGARGASNKFRNFSQQVKTCVKPKGRRGTQALDTRGVRKLCASSF